MISVRSLQLVPIEKIRHFSFLKLYLWRFLTNNLLRLEITLFN